MADGPLRTPALRAPRDGDLGPDDAPPDSRKRLRGWRPVVLAFVSAGLVTVIVLSAGPSRIARVFADIGWLGALHLLSLYTLGQFLRAARFTVCIAPPRPALPRMFALVCMHQFLNHVLPARLGELSFPLLASRYAAVSKAAATRLLVVIRVFELIILGGFFLVAASSLLFRTEARVLEVSIVVCAVVVLLMIFFLFRGMPGLIRTARRALDRIRLTAWQRSGLRSRLLAYLDALHQEFLRPHSMKEAILVTSFTVLVWLVLFWINYQVLRYAGIDVSFSDSIVGSTFANVSHVLPINTFGSIGSLEAGWTFGFVLLGVPAKAALASGFALHAIGIAFLSVAASVSWITLRPSAKDRLGP